MADCELKLYVKQGENISKGFTVREGDNPLSLINYSIRFQVKDNPYEDVEPLIDKLITTNSDINTVGIINNPSQGKFQVKLTSEDTSLDVDEYYLIISLVNENTSDIISSTYCNNAKYIVCTQ